MASIHEEEVLGKAYDSRLMKRLLKYLRPYTWQVAIALGAIILKAGADVLGPYLTKIAIDRYLTHALAVTGGLSIQRLNLHYCADRSGIINDEPRDIARSGGNIDNAHIRVAGTLDMPFTGARKIAS